MKPRHKKLALIAVVASNCIPQAIGAASHPN